MPQPKGKISDKRLAELAAQAELAAIEKELPASEISVNFRVTYRCAFGECLAVVGSSNELGGWDVASAPRMFWSEGDVWTVTKIFKYQTAPIAYKYVVVQHGNPFSPVLRWEAGDNHLLRLPSGGVIQLKLFDQWELTQ